MAVVFWFPIGFAVYTDIIDLIGYPTQKSEKRKKKPFYETLDLPLIQEKVQKICSYIIFESLNSSPVRGKPLKQINGWKCLVGGCAAIDRLK